MRIGIDGSVFIDKQFTGVTKSVYEIIRRWMVKYPEHEYYIISRTPIYLDLKLPENWHCIITMEEFDKKLPLMEKHGKIWNILKLPGVIQKLDLDAYWGTNYILPIFTNKKTKYYVTIYDLALYIFDGIGERSNLIKLKLFCKNACRIAEKVVAISKATADDIERIFKINKDKIAVSYCGNSKQKREYDIEKVKDVIKFKEDFFLFISTIEPRKNIITIIKAFEEYCQDTMSTTKLVIAGKKGWNCENVFEVIKISPYKSRIIIPGYISDDDKSYLLSNAKAFLYPSLYEGFGLPVLEAFEYGLPVITSNNSSLPEVGGDAAFYIDDCHDHKKLCELMIEVEKMDIADREVLKKKMDIQLNKFSWDRNADEMMDIISGKRS